MNKNFSELEFLTLGELMLTNLLSVTSHGFEEDGCDYIHCRCCTYGGIVNKNNTITSETPYYCLTEHEEELVRQEKRKARQETYKNIVIF